ncbi:MAG TPA: hypothetical protein VGM05_21000 [Planctomycetaceae bacterium]
MESAEILPAPVIDQPLPADEKRNREKQAFLKLLPDLIQSHRGLFVAIHDGRVVESGCDPVIVGHQAYEKFGYIPIFIGHVDDHPLPPVRIPSHRVLSAEGV